MDSEPEDGTVGDTAVFASATGRMAWVDPKERESQNRHILRTRVRPFTLLGLLCVLAGGSVHGTKMLALLAAGVFFTGLARRNMATLDLTQTEVEASRRVGRAGWILLWFLGWFVFLSLNSELLSADGVGLRALVVTVAWPLVVWRTMVWWRQGPGPRSRRMGALDQRAIGAPDWALALATAVTVLGAFAFVVAILISLFDG